MFNTIEKQGNDMSDNDKYTKQAISKSMVKASEEYDFGEKTLSGLILIIIPLAVQLIFLLINVTDTSEPNEEMTLSDLENATADLEIMLTVQMWFSILTIGAQLVGLLLIWSDVKGLSRSLNEDVNVRNDNLVAIVKAISKK
tara:strand:+ start:2135 stop:2560 length:426 start_codon:yes stop_codon:yes gene_type:complete